MLPEDALSFLVEYVQSQTAVTHKAGLVTSCYNSIAGSQTAKLSELIFMKVRQLLMLISTFRNLLKSTVTKTFQCTCFLMSVCTA